MTSIEFEFLVLIIILISISFDLGAIKKQLKPLDEYDDKPNFCSALTGPLWNIANKQLEVKLARPTPRERLLLAIRDKKEQPESSKETPIPAAPELPDLFHKLWSKAVGTEGYQKSEWLELERILRQAQH